MFSIWSYLLMFVSMLYLLYTYIIACFSFLYFVFLMLMSCAFILSLVGPFAGSNYSSQCYVPLGRTRQVDALCIWHVVHKVLKYGTAHRTGSGELSNGTI